MENAFLLDLENALLAVSSCKERMIFLNDYIFIESPSSSHSNKCFLSQKNGYLLELNYYIKDKSKAFSFAGDRNYMDLTIKDSDSQTIGNIKHYYDD